jgi:signal transduction histidine kinase
VSAHPQPAQDLEALLASIAHDLRSPLNGMKVWATVLESQLHDADDPAVRRAVDGILQGIEQQARLIDQLLDEKRCDETRPRA